MKFKLTFFMVSGKSYEMEWEREAYARVEEEIRGSEGWISVNGKLIHKRNIECIDVTEIGNYASQDRYNPDKMSVMQ